MQVESGDVAPSILDRIEVRLQEQYFKAHEQELLQQHPGQCFVVSGYKVYMSPSISSAFMLAIRANPDGKAYGVQPPGCGRGWYHSTSASQ